jgi:hypothetical protein
MYTKFAQDLSNQLSVVTLHEKANLTNQRGTAAQVVANASADVRCKFRSRPVDKTHLGAAANFEELGTGRSKLHDNPFAPLLSQVVPSRRNCLLHTVVPPRARSADHLHRTGVTGSNRVSHFLAGPQPIRITRTMNDLADTGVCQTRDMTTPTKIGQQELTKQGNNLQIKQQLGIKP